MVTGMRKTSQPTIKASRSILSTWSLAVVIKLPRVTDAASKGRCSWSPTTGTLAASAGLTEILCQSHSGLRRFPGGRRQDLDHLVDENSDDGPAHRPEQNEAISK